MTVTRSSLLQMAEAHCATGGHRLTDPRRHVLEIIAAAKKPIGAYDIIAAMPGGAKPPTVYRALEFWEREGFIHGISSLNVYTVCDVNHRHAGSQFMVCDSCGDVQEVHLCHLPGPLQARVEQTGFALSRWNTELHGMCRSCQT